MRAGVNSFGHPLEVGTCNNNMMNIKDWCKKHLCNKKIMFGAYVAGILILLVLLISSHRNSLDNESMASEVKTIDPVSQLTQVPEERLGKEESRIETLARIEKEEKKREEKLRRDSLDKEDAKQAANAKRLEQSIRKSLHYAQDRSNTRSYGQTGNNMRGNTKKNLRDENMQDELSDFEKFKMEMARLDSLEKAGITEDKKEDSSNKKSAPPEAAFFVYKEGYKESPYFNTIIDSEEPSNIKAMVDEVVKAKQSSRVRLRLLDDITVAGKIIPRNHYLYAHVSGFGGQRIMLTVSSLLLHDKVYNINLEVYDLDGYAGLYVPKSSFQEFMQELNGGMIGSTDIRVDESNSSRLAEMGYNMLDDLINTSKKALQNKAKANKAKIKYNTQVLLINSNERNK